MLALVLEFFKIVKDKWLSDGPIDLFTESMTIAKLSYDIYKVPDQEEFVGNLS